MNLFLSVNFIYNVLKVNLTVFSGVMFSFIFFTPSKHTALFTAYDHSVAAKDFYQDQAFMVYRHLDCGLSLYPASLLSTLHLCFPPYLALFVEKLAVE